MSSFVARIDPLAQSLLARPLLVRSLQVGTLVGLGVLTGIATCLHTWVIPIVRQARTARTKTQQFRTAVTLGATYLQPTSKIFAVALASLAFLCSRSENHMVASRWKFYAAALGAMLPVAPYEITTVFPTNDRLFELNDAIEEAGKDNFGDERDQEIDTLLTSWQRWHTGRVVMPLVASSILAWGAWDLLPL